MQRSRSRSRSQEPDQPQPSTPPLAVRLQQAQRRALQQACLLRDTPPQTVLQQQAASWRLQQQQMQALLNLARQVRELTESVRDLAVNLSALEDIFVERAASNN